MANPYIGWVNKQVVAVRYHLSLVTDAENANQRLRNTGVLESAAWHFQRAYRFYLYELGANYQLNSPEDQNTAVELGAALEAIGKHPGEAVELATLESDGWIADLLNSVSDTNRSNTSAAVDPLGSALQLVDLEYQEKQLSRELINEWLAKFKELVDRHRDVMVEY